MDMRWAGSRMWTLPLRPSVELPMGPRNVSEVCRHGHAVDGEPHVDPATGPSAEFPMGPRNV
eukprot:7811136-Pyramimonas_sp.AAC.1